MSVAEQAKQRRLKLPESLKGVLGVISFVVGIWLLGDIFRSYTLPFAFLWVAIPMFAFLLRRRSVSACFTLVGLRRVQITLMVVVGALSFIMFAHRDHVRNKFGLRFVQGYHYWRGEPATDDNGQMYYPGDDWTAKNRSGRWLLDLFELILLVGVFALPAVTLKATRRAIAERESECPISSDGKRVETYETNA